ncbi:hypothetical protein [Ruicaihuangia caeni]|uniref:Type 4 fimbrial biogenesis protein PilX N-terminal domain-containing protein n=1 Tax=Ruicaihuangia caeni TaxID=3042517 RepID=A0AAW6T650_9MICO|nr:hypothetical protein [Klugiella sp. YN-L-19]MDI2098551.1 hypothetical protein [Klugiella sp. YN-L-19]
MLLNRIAPSAQEAGSRSALRPSSIRRTAQDERGGAMVAVIGVMAVLAIVTATVTVVTTQAIGVSSSSRAEVQARAAAEAGIDVATAALMATGACVDVIDSPAGSVPRYSVTIEHNEGAGWAVGCPSDVSTEVRILATGFAEAKGVAGVSGGDQVTIETVHSYDPIITHVPVAGSAVYAYNMAGALKKFELSSPDQSLATSVSIKHGNVTCTNGAKIGGDLIVGDGNAKLDMCDVAGSVHVNGNTSINKSNIGGIVRGTGTGQVTASTIGGTPPSQFGAGVAMPTIPEWVDVPGDHAFWQAQGYQIVNWTGPCTIDKNTTAWYNMSTYTTPRVIDFRAKCPTTKIWTRNDLDPVTLNTDIVMLAHEFQFDKLYFNASQDRKLHFIVPDDVAGDGPTCAPPASLTGGIYNTDEAKFGDHVAAIAYTPCKVQSDRPFRGQFYGGEVEFHQQAAFTFVPVGIPGVDLAGGVTQPVQTGATLGARLSYRDLPAGG